MREHEQQQLLGRVLEVGSVHLERAQPRASEPSISFAEKRWLAMRPIPAIRASAAQKSHAVAMPATTVR